MGCCEPPLPPASGTPGPGEAPPSPLPADAPDMWPFGLDRPLLALLGSLIITTVLLITVLYWINQARPFRPPRWSKIKKGIVRSHRRRWFHSNRKPARVAKHRSR